MSQENSLKLSFQESVHYEAARNALATLYTQPETESVATAEAELPDLNVLYNDLGRRKSILDSNPASAGDYSGQECAIETESFHDWAKLGQNYFERIAINAYPYICGCAELASDKDKELLAKALNVPNLSGASLLSTVLVSLLGISPIVAPIIGAIVLKLFVSSGKDVVCKDWASKLPKDS